MPLDGALVVALLVVAWGLLRVAQALTGLRHDWRTGIPTVVLEPDNDHEGPRDV